MASDTEEICRLIGLHAQLTDDGDYDARVLLYAEDGTFQMGDNPVVEGQAALKESFAASSARGKHITANPVVKVEGDRASATTDFIFAMAGEAGLGVMAAGRYYDTFTRSGGEWRYASRRITFMGA
jgi:ketosteroid isomerase-like protein